MKVYVVEDSEVFRDRLTALLATLQSVELVGVASSVEQAIATLPTLQPDLVLLDLQLGDGNGLQVLRAVKPVLPGVRFVVVTNYPYPQYREACQEAGADHFLDKAKAFDDLVELLPTLLAQAKSG